MTCSNKYMYTKENWNPNVYNIEIDYKDIPSNRREIFIEELVEISKHFLPISQKAFVEFKSKHLTKDNNTLKLNTNYEFKNLEETKRYNINTLNKSIKTVSLSEKEPVNIKIYQYRLNLNLGDIDIIKIKRKGNLIINNKLTNYKILKNNTILNIKESKDKTFNTEYINSTGKDKDLYIENETGEGILEINTTNQEYIQEIRLYKLK